MVTIPERIVEFLKKTGQASIAEIARGIGASYSGTYYYIAGDREDVLKDKIKRVGVYGRNHSAVTVWGLKK